MSNYVSSQIALIDASLPDWQSLVAGLPAGMEVQTFTSLAQIAQWASGHAGEYAALHLFSHGASGTLKLGMDTLNSQQLNQATVQAQLRVLGQALTTDGDLLLYGCNVAQGQTGANFIGKLAQITHADVAASSNLTGNTALGGDWVLESTHSTVDAHPLALPHYAHLLVETAVLVKDIATGSSSSNPSNLTNVNGTLYFTATDGTNGYELWKSDGTAAGTVLVKDIYTGSITSTPIYLTNVNGTLYFRASNGTNGIELWKTDGMTAGTVMVKDIWAGGDSYPYSLTNVNGTLYFQANDGTNGYELWKSDADGTVMVKDIRAGGSSNPSSLTNVNGTLYFRANNGTNGIELWKTNGTDVGTVMVKDIWAGGDSSPNSLTNVNGTLYFTANDGTNGIELWKSDAAGTVMVKDIRAGGSSNPTYLTNVNGTLYFTANDGTNGNELWKSDGTDAGTVLVKDIYTGSTASNPAWLTNVNGTLYFRADNGTNGNELWKSDADGTVMVKDIWTGGNSSPSSLTNVNGTLYFQATDGTNGTELWKTDGTAASTVLVKDIRAGGNSSPANLTNVNGTLYFQATDGTNGVELWKIASATPPTTTITAATLSADTGSNTTDWITNTAAQTISGTLSTALAVDESVQVSYNNGTTWSAATSTVGSTSWSATATLAGSGTFQARVINAGANGTAYSQAYILDTTIATPTLALAVDTGSSNSDGKTSNGQVNVSGLESGGTWQYSTDAGANWSTGTGSSFTLTGDGAKSVTVRQTDVAGNVSAESSALAFTLDTAAPTTSTITANDLSSPSGATFTFTVPYTDTGAGIDSSTIDIPNVTVTGPAGVGALTVSAASFGAGVATYTVDTPHSGAWSSATDAGTYTIGINGSSVKDLAGNVVAAAASAKTFAVSFNAAPVITSSGSGSVAENAAITTVVYATVATDAENDVITYSLTGTDVASFDIDSATGVVTLKASADYETQSSYGITVNAKDASHAPTAKSVTIGITDVNEAPTDITLSANSVAENTATASALTIGSLTSTDPDAGNTFNYSLVGGDDQASFQITGNSLQFKAGTVLNYEAKSSYAVTVRTTDQGGLTYDEALTVNLTNVNEKPAITAPAAQNVTQAAATAITGISLLDPDAGANLISLTLAAATGTLTASNGSGVTVANSGTASITLNGTQASLNSFIATSKVSYTSVVGATGNVTLTMGSDDGGNSGSGSAQIDNKTETLTIVPPVVPPVIPPVVPPVIPTTPEPVNEAPKAIELQNATTRLPENTSTANALKVADIQITDDALGTNTLTLSGADAGNFQLIGNALFLKAGTVLDFETQASYQLNIQASDSTLPTSSPVTTTFTLNLSNMVETSQKPVSNAPATLPAAATWNTLSDKDGDGSPEQLENYVTALNVTGALTGDGNGDSQFDASQNSVDSMPFLKTATAVSAPGNAISTFLTLVADSLAGKPDTTDDNTAQLRSVVQKDAPVNLPADMKMPLGLIQFTALVSQKGQSETFSLYVDNELNINGYWAKNATGVWVNLASTPYGGQMVNEGGKLRLDFKIIDGGEFDTDNQADGVISDVGAVASMPVTLAGQAPVIPGLAAGFWL